MGRPSLYRKTLNLRNRLKLVAQAAPRTHAVTNLITLSPFHHKVYSFTSQQ